MKIFGWFKKHIFSVISIVLISALSVYVCGFALKNAKNYKIYEEQKIETKIYSVWHIETFEGGSKPRIQILKQVARTLEKENAGVLFMVSAVSPTDLEQKLENEQPDIISFGFGIGKIVLPYLCEFDSNFNVRDNLINSSTYANKIMAVPFIASGYATFSHGGEIKSRIYGKTNHTMPNLSGNEIAFNSQYEAYKEFVYNKKSALIGTARDVFRVSNLNNIGRLNSIITPLNDYTDLIQYCGVVNHDKLTSQFIEHLLDAKTQASLCDYSLFSVKYNKIYSSGIYSDMENAIFSATTPNVFEE